MKGTSPAARSASGVPEWDCRMSNSIERGEVMAQITTAGIDLAKKVFALHGIEGSGNVALRRTVRRDQLLGVVASLPPCLIAPHRAPKRHVAGPFDAVKR